MPPVRVVPSVSERGGPMTLRKMPLRWSHEAANWHDRAHAAAAIGSLRAGIPALDAERRRDRALAGGAQLGAAIRAQRAVVAGRLAGRVERGAHAASAGATA